jgi:hypothetical protein
MFFLTFFCVVCVLATYRPRMVDYHGQQLVEKIFRAVMWSFALVGFLVGYFVAENFYVTFFIALLGALVAAAAVVPEWDYLNQHPILFSASNKDKAE